jgi:cytochrome c553
MKALTIGLAALMLGFVNVAVAGDAAAGKEKSSACVACHGEDGIATQALTPNLKGQKEDYLVLSTKAYKDGSRNNDMMKMFVMSLSDEDIANLAAYYASL